MLNIFGIIALTLMEFEMVH